MAIISLFLSIEKSLIRHDVKRKMIAGLDPEELVLLKFSKLDEKTNLHWKHSKEFEYNGQMFDVVSKEIKGDSILFRCWWDHKETSLNKRLRILVAKALHQDKKSGNARRNLRFYFGILYYKENAIWRALPNSDNTVVYQEVNRTEHLSSLQISPPTPPPKDIWNI